MIETSNGCPNFDDKNYRTMNEMRRNSSPIVAVDVWFIKTTSNYILNFKSKTIISFLFSLHKLRIFLSLKNSHLLIAVFQGPIYFTLQ